MRNIRKEVVSQFRKKLILSIALSSTNKVLDLMPPVIVSWLVALLSGNGLLWINKTIASLTIKQQVVALVIFTVLIFIAESLTEWLGKKSYMTLAQDILHFTRENLVKEYLNKKMAFFDKFNLGNNLAIASTDVNNLEKYYGTGLYNLTQLIVLAIIANAILFSANWYFSIMIFIPMPIIAYLSIVYQKKLYLRFLDVRKSNGRLISRIENAFSNIFIVKSFNKEIVETEKIKKTSDKYKLANYHSINLSTIFIPMVRMIVVIIFAGFLLMGSLQYLNGKMQLSTIVLFSMMLQRLLWPMTKLGEVLEMKQNAGASWNRINQVFCDGMAVDENKMDSLCSFNNGNIFFDRVSFKYDTRKVLALNNVSFKVSQGQKVLLLGNTGSGKTTITKLLVKFYKCQSGNIYFNGLSISSYPSKLIRENITIVSQEVYLFRGAIFDNLIYGCEIIPSIEQVIEVCKAVCLHEFISELPKGYDSVVGERGVDLSGGQKQRLNIARGILRNTSIIVFDEPTSAINTEIADEVFSNIASILKDKTVFIITHRPGINLKIDGSLVFKNGQIIENTLNDDHELDGIKTNNNRL